MMIARRKALVFAWLLGLGVVSAPFEAQAQVGEVKEFSPEERKAAKKILRRVQRARIHLFNSLLFTIYAFEDCGLYENEFYQEEIGRELTKAVHPVSMLQNQDGENMTIKEAFKTVKQLELEKLGSMTLPSNHIKRLLTYFKVDNTDQQEGVQLPIFLAKSNSLENEIEEVDLKGFNFSLEQIAGEENNFLQGWSNLWESNWDRVRKSEEVTYKTIVLSYHKASRWLQRIDSLLHEARAALYAEIQPNPRFNEDQRNALLNLTETYKYRSQELKRLRNAMRREYNNRPIFIPDGVNTMTLLEMIYTVSPLSESFLKKNMRQIRKEIKRLKVQPKEDVEEKEEAAQAAAGA